MEGLWKRGENGMGAGTGTPFRDKPPPPRLSRKGALRAGSSINAPLRDNRGGGGGLSRKGVLSRLLYQPFYKIVQIFSSFLFSLRWCVKDNRTQYKKKRKGDYCIMGGPNYGHLFSSSSISYSELLSHHLIEELLFYNILANPCMCRTSKNYLQIAVSNGPSFQVKITR